MQSPSSDMSSQRQSMRFRLAISAEQYLAYYSGQARNILAYSEDGRRIRFPASAVKPFLSHEGIHGRFEITYDSSNKLVGLRRIS